MAIIYFSQSHILHKQTKEIFNAQCREHKAKIRWDNKKCFVYSKDAYFGVLVMWKMPFDTENWQFLPYTLKHVYDSYQNAINLILFSFPIVIIFFFVDLAWKNSTAKTILIFVLFSYFSTPCMLHEQ